MDDREFQRLLRSEGERLNPGQMPDLVAKGRSARRRRIAGISTVVAALVGTASVVGAHALGDDDTGGPVSVAESPTAPDGRPAPSQADGCPAGVISVTEIDTGFLAPEGFKSLTALGMSLDDWPSGVRSVSTVEVLEETGTKARLLLLSGDNQRSRAVAHATLTEAGWVATHIEFCQ